LPSDFRTRSARRPTAWLAILAVLIQLFVPMARPAALADAGPSGAFVSLCTAEGPKLVRIPDMPGDPGPRNESPSPQSRLQTCVLCVGHLMADPGLVPTTTAFPPSIAKAARRLSPAARRRAGKPAPAPAFPRGPPGLI